MIWKKSAFRKIMSLGKAQRFLNKSQVILEKSSWRR
jgi:hypothetical protein